MKKEHIPIIIAIALPILFITILSVMIYLPNMSVRPQYDFVYTLPTTYNEKYEYKYTLDNGELMRERTSEDLTNNRNTVSEAPTLYLYDVHKDTAKQISFEDAQQYALIPGPSSPDGYTVGFHRNSYGLFDLFGSSGRESGFYISQGNASKRLTGISTDTYRSYYSTFQLIGWIE